MRKRLWTNALWTLVLVAGTAHAGLKQVSEGVWLEDFEDGRLDAWQAADPTAADIGESADGHRYLKLGGIGLNGLMWLKGRTFDNFVLEVKVRRLYGAGQVGIRFRDNCSAYFHAKGRLELASYGKKRLHTRELKRVRDLQQNWNTIRLICAGEVVTAYVDGDFACQLIGVPATPGRVGLFARERAYFDGVKIVGSVKPEHYLGYEVLADDNCLVFEPGRDFSLRLRVANHYAKPQTVPVRLVVRDWRKKPLTTSKTVTVTIPAGGQAGQTFALAGLREGYYQVMVEPIKMIFPLAIQLLPPPDAAKRPEKWPGRKGADLLFGAYWYYKHWMLPELWKNTYCHAAARDLQRHGFNAVVNMIGMPTDQVKILSQYGISCFSRGGNHMDYPLLAGTFVGDEPRADDIPKYVAQYKKIREKFDVGDRTITTCMIGDGGLEGAERAWQELLPLGGVRLFRWYGIKKGHFGVLLPYRGIPFTEVLRDARSGCLKDGYPYWVILPSLGSHGPAAYFGLPTASQVRSMMHLAAAYKARGFIFWTYQDAGLNSKGLVNPVSLLPNDDRWAEAGKIAVALQKHAPLLESLKPGGTNIWCDNALVERVPYADPAGNQYVYAVNKHPTQSATFRLFRMQPGLVVRDVYSGKEWKAAKETVTLFDGTRFDTGAVHLTLGPGDGMLLQVRQGVAAGGAKPVAFPEWVQKAPKENVQYLYDLDPSNTPSPGWVRRAMMHRMKKSIAEMWKWHGGTIRLYSSMTDPGVEYPKSLYGHAECRIDYNLPPGYTHFVAAAGFGAKAPGGDVIFQVFVDGKKKFDSGVRRTGEPVLPVIVEIADAKRLSLVTDAADYSIANDYVFWGSARLIKR